MPTYFNLLYGINITYGKNGAVIYDNIHRKMFDVHGNESQILRDIETGRSIEQIHEHYPKALYTDFLKHLKDLDLVDISDTFVPREYYRYGPNIQSPRFTPMTLKRCFIEFPFTCSNNCSHCTSQKLFGCYACSQTSNPHPINFEFYSSLVQELVCFHCKQYIFYGGDLTHTWSSIQNLFTLLRSLDSVCRIYVVFPISSSILSLENSLNRFNITPIINIEWNSSFVFPNFELNVIYNFLVTESRFQDFSKARTSKEYKGHNYLFSVLPEKRELRIDYIAENLTLDYNTIYNQLIAPLHPCLGEQLTIKSDQKIYVCKNFSSPIGELTSDGLHQFFLTSRTYYDYWTRKHTCHACKFRTSCLDCVSYNRGNPNQTLCSHVEDE